MRTVGAGVKTEKSSNVAELEAENRGLWEANESARNRINDLEIMLDESRQQAAELQKQLEESQEQAAELQKQLEESQEQAAELLEQLNEVRTQAGENQKSKSSKEKNVEK